MTNRVIIVEDDLVLQEHLCETIAGLDGFSVLGCADSVAEGLDLLAQEPEIALIDLELVDGSGLDLIEKASAETDTKVIVITVLGDEQSVLRAFDAGAHGFLLKDGDSQRVESALSDVIAGRSPISAAAATHLLRRLRRPARETADFKLTQREIELLELLAKGLTNAEVARCLDISPKTVGTHAKKIYRKMSVHSRSEAVFEAVNVGLIRFGE